jgi:capsular polysaccharide transport system permease protein
MSTRFGRKPGGYVWAIAEPAAHIAVMTFIFSVFSRSPAVGTSFPLFFATGFLSFQYYRGAESYIRSAVKANYALLSYPRVAPIDPVIARALLQFLTTTLVGAIVIGVIIAYMRTPPEIDWMKVIESILLATFFGLSMGMINCVLFSLSSLYEQVFNMLNRPLYYMSGVFYLVDAIPQPYRSIVLLNPMSHVIMLARKGFYSGYRAPELDVLYAGCFAAVTLFVAMYLFTSSTDTLRNR